MHGGRGAGRQHLPGGEEELAGCGEGGVRGDALAFRIGLHRLGEEGDEAGDRAGNGGEDVDLGFVGEFGGGSYGGKEGVGEGFVCRCGAWGSGPGREGEALPCGGGGHGADHARAAGERGEPGEGETGHG